MWPKKRSDPAIVRDRDACADRRSARRPPERLLGESSAYPRVSKVSRSSAPNGLPTERESAAHVEIEVNEVGLLETFLRRAVKVGDLRLQLFVSVLRALDATRGTTTASTTRGGRTTRAIATKLA